MHPVCSLCSRWRLFCLYYNKQEDYFMCLWCGLVMDLSVDLVLSAARDHKHVCVNRPYIPLASGDRFYHDSDIYLYCCCDYTDFLDDLCGCILDDILS